MVVDKLRVVLESTLSATARWEKPMERRGGPARRRSGGGLLRADHAGRLIPWSSFRTNGALLLRVLCDRHQWRWRSPGGVYFRGASESRGSCVMGKNLDGRVPHPGGVSAGRLCRRSPLSVDAGRLAAARSRPVGLLCPCSRRARRPGVQFFLAPAHYPRANDLSFALCARRRA